MSTRTSIYYGNNVHVFIDGIDGFIADDGTIQPIYVEVTTKAVEAIVEIPFSAAVKIHAEMDVWLRHIRNIATQTDAEISDICKREVAARPTGSKWRIFHTMEKYGESTDPPEKQIAAGIAFATALRAKFIAALAKLEEK